MQSSRPERWQTKCYTAELAPKPTHDCLRPGTFANGVAHGAFNLGQPFFCTAHASDADVVGPLCPWAVGAQECNFLSLTAHHAYCTDHPVPVSLVHHKLGHIVEHLWKVAAAPSTARPR